jgi:HEPN domain-containing protein
MASRADDWFRQAERDLGHARTSAEAGDHEWAAFAAQQTAEKALKAVLQAQGVEARGHAAHALLRTLPTPLLDGADVEALRAAARELDRHYIPSRYPNSIPEGAPFEVYDEEQSKRAIAAAERILGFCQRHLA